MRLLRDSVPVDRSGGEEGCRVTLHHVLFINGSTRPGKTTSDSIARFIMEKLKPMGVEGTRYQVSELIKRPESIRTLLQLINEAELLVMIIPLNVDSLSFPTILLMEQMASFKEKGLLKGKKTAAIVHSGYPEEAQRKPALSICRCFAEEMDMEWLGGVGFGGTSLIAGRDLVDVGFLTKGLRKTLAEMAVSFREGSPLSQKTYKRANKSVLPIPTTLLCRLINHMVRKQMKEKRITEEAAFSQPFCE